MKTKNKTAENMYINRFFYKMGIFLIFLFLLAILIIRTFRVNLLETHLPCVINKFTGYYCPGCGGTRAVRSLLGGRILESLIYHPVVVYGLFIFLWFMFTNTIERLSKGKIPIGLNYSDRYLWIGLGITICNFLIKNISIFLTGSPGI